MHEAVVTRTSIKLRNSFLFRFRRRERVPKFYSVGIACCNDSTALANHDMRKTWRSHGPRGHDTALNRIIQQ